MSSSSSPSLAAPPSAATTATPSVPDCEMAPSSQPSYADNSGVVISNGFNGTGFRMPPHPNREAEPHYDMHTLSHLPDTVMAGHRLWVFYRMQISRSASSQYCWMAVSSPADAFMSPPTGWSDRWMTATVARDWRKSEYRPNEKHTWPLVCYDHSLWYERGSMRLDTSRVTENVPAGDLKLTPPNPRPSVSIHVVRWANPEAANEWDFPSWGETGSTISDAYIVSLLGELYRRVGPDYEVLTTYVKCSAELDKISERAIACQLTGRHRAGMYFLWVCEFEDSCNPNIGGFVARDPFFNLLTRMEAIGICTRFPHTSHLHRTIVAKDLYSHLCLQEDLRLPKCVKVSRGSVITSAHSAAQSALDNLRILMDNRPLVRGGVCKLGYSWEAMDVRTFNAEASSLASQMQDILLQPTCRNDSVLVQERVPNSLEMRFITTMGEVRHVTYSTFARISEDGLYRDFERSMDRTEAAQRWFNGDVAGLQEAESICHTCMRAWQRWMLTESDQPAPALRYDFIIGRDENDKLTVYLGELCELGFSIMDYPYAERDVFGAVVDSISWDRPCRHAGVNKLQPQSPPCGLCLSGAKLPVKPPTVSEESMQH
ncbi:Sphingosine kinase 2 [Perkinsus olseni]|uniref:Sphingosine kinase 2 n=1 Tax=Perkinsus olseni TaxID=32597 RepID=A0A7J6PC59_PEROL|nr:Sphingosine kinase 2 [Perkinsus olseni]